MNKQLSSWFFGRRIGLGFVLSVLVCGAGAESAQVYVDRIAADKRDIPAYIGLTEFQIQELDQKVALKTQKRGLRYAKANGQKLALRTLGIRLWGMTGDVKKALREYKRGLRVKGSAQFPALLAITYRVHFIHIANTPANMEHIVITPANIADTAKTLFLERHKK